MAASSAKIAAAAFSLAALLASCSLDYTQDQDSASSSPEFTLRAAAFFRYEDNAMSFSLASPRIERYASPPATFAEDAVFATYSKDGLLEARGSCALLGIGQEGRDGDPLLSFYGDVVMEKPGDGTMLETDALKWNTGTGRLASSAQGVSTLTRGGLILEGRGFSAREKGFEFSFASAVSGFIIADGGEGGQ